MRVDWKSCFRVCTSLFLLYLCITYWKSFTSFASAIISAATPLIVGCVLAYIINILMSFYEKHYFLKSMKVGVIKSRRPVCMIAAFVTLAIAIALVVKMVVPELVACVELLLAKIPGAMRELTAWLNVHELLPEDMAVSMADVDWQAKIEQIISFFATGVGNVMGTAIGVVSTVFSGIVTALFAFIFSIYLLTGKEKLGDQFDRLMKRYLKNKSYSKIRYVLSVINDCFHKYIVGQCTEAVILGTLCMVGMLLLNLPYATMTGAVIAFTALIPVAGAYIGAAVGAFMILTVSPIQAVVFLIYIIVLQQLEGNLVYPRVVGSSMGLPAIWVLAAVTIGGGVMGVAGMLIGIPLATTIYRLLREDVNRGAGKVEGDDEIDQVGS